MTLIERQRSSMCLNEQQFRAKVDTLYKHGYRWMNPGRNYDYWQEFKERTTLRTHVSSFCGEKYMIYGQQVNT